MASQKARKSFAMASHRASWCHCGNCQHPEALQSCLWRPCPRAQLAQSHWNQFGWCVFARHRWANFETLHHKHVLVISWPIDCHRKFEQMQKTNPTLSLYKASWCPAGISKHCRNPLVLGRSCCSTPGRSKPPPPDVWVPMVRSC